MHITTDLTEVSVNDLLDLYNDAGYSLEYTSDLINLMYPKGTYGTFIFDGAKLVGAIRALSDNFIATWIAEICVDENCDVAKVQDYLLTHFSSQFSHTAIFCHAFEGQIDALRKIGVKQKSILTATSGRARVNHDFEIQRLN